MTDEEAKRWAEIFIQSWNDQYEYCVVREDEEFTGEFPEEHDWETVYEKMSTAKIEVTWDE